MEEIRKSLRRDTITRDDFNIKSANCLYFLLVFKKNNYNNTQFNNIQE